MPSPKPLLPFPAGCIFTRFLRREKRFTAVTEDPDGAIILAHTNNTGSMLGLTRPGTQALLSPAPARPGAPPRKLAWTLEALWFHDLAVGVNTLTPNRMLRAAWTAGLLPEVRAYTTFQSEAPSGESRLDARLDGANGSGGPLFVECKNVTLVEDDRAIFPDAASERGRKHLVELMRLRSQGVRAALFFLIQRPDGHCFAAADMVDPEYARLLAQAAAAGVEIWPWRAQVSAAGVALAEMLPVRLE